MNTQSVANYIEPASDILQWARAVVEAGCILTMLVAPILCFIFVTRAEFDLEGRVFKTKPYIGEGVIRFLALAEIIPAIVILGLGGILDKASAGTLLAGVSGYVLGSMGDRRSSGGPNSSKPSGTPQPSPHPRPPKESETEHEVHSKLTQ